MTVALLHSSQVKLTNPLPNTLHYKIHKKQVVQQNSPVQKVIRTKQTHNQSLKADQNMASIGKSIGAASTHTKSQTIASQLVPSTAAGSSSLLDQNLPNQKSITSNNMNQRIWSLEKSGAFALFFLLISVSSPVSCFPLGGEAELTSIPQRQVPPISSSSSSASSSLVDVGSDGTSLRNVNYMAKPQSQLFHPSLFKSPPTAEEYGDEWPQQRFDRQQEFGVEANLDPANSPQQHQHLQKLQPNSARGAELGSSEADWETVIDPHLYLLTEWNSNASPQPLQQQQRMRRNSGGPSLSIVNPLDVLRQRLLLEIARRKMRQSQNQIMLNADLLQKIGRRRRR